MMIGFFDVAIPIDREKLLTAGTIPKLEPAATLEDRAEELLSEFDNDGDGKLAKAELPKQFQGLFILLDRNRDGFLDTAEVLVFVKASAGRRRAPVATSAGSRPHRPKRRRAISPHTSEISRPADIRRGEFIQAALNENLFRLRWLDDDSVESSQDDLQPPRRLRADIR